MKKYAIILILLLFQGNPGWVHKNYDEEINTIINAVDFNYFTMEEWEIVHIGSMNKAEFMGKLNKLEETYTVQKESKAQAVKYHLHNKADQLAKHDLYAVVPFAANSNVQFQVVYQGKEWNDKIELNMTKSMNILNKHLQFDDDGIFTCIKLNYDGIMNLGLSVEKLMNNLEIVHTKQFEDNVENTIYDKTFYGYSPLFNQSIEITDEDYNFQLTTRNVTNNKKQVIIGTPLILNEY